ncbi:MAG: Hsp20/alpha crystallin family protein [Myxococcaceae bacterium]|nr:Hsp20/alpha crystallin family protein [Myxococcaceae bacterium]MCI0669999.1 Hsp20/alpha crystallin family protein [Myxococcaceae bacterium]
MAELPIRSETGGLTRRGWEWDPFERMRELMRWDPLQALRQLAPSPAATTAFAPDFDVKETKDSFIFKADLPGVKENDVDISLTGDRLTVTGKREEEKTEEGERFYAYERTFGSFSRSFTLPEGVSAEDVRAEMKNGVLTLTLPKKPEVQTRHIRLGPEDTKAKP